MFLVARSHGRTTLHDARTRGCFGHVFHRPTRRNALQTDASSDPSISASGAPARTVDAKYNDFLDAWDKTFMDADEEREGYWIEEVEGVVPRQMEGTIFRNGPNGFANVDHPYDADGFIASLSFEDGRAFFRSRFVQTAERQADRYCDRAVFRGTFLTQRDGQNFGDLHVKNTSNTNVVAYANRLFSLWEAGQPYELDPVSLETIGIATFAGTTPRGLPFDLGNDISNTIMGSMVRFAQSLSGDEVFSSQDGLPETLTNAGGWAQTAHPSICPNTGRFVTFAYTMRMGLPSLSDFSDLSDVSFPPMFSEIRFMEFEDPDRPPVVERTVKLRGYSFLHDFGLTERHYVIFLNPVTVDTWSMVSGEAPAAGSVRWVENKPTKIMVIPRDPAEEVRSFNIDPCFVFHHAGCFEDGDDLVIDSIHYPSLPSVGKEASPKQGLDPNAAFQSRLNRVRVSNWKSEEAAEVTVEQLFDEYLEMVSTNPAAERHRYVYGYASNFERALIGVARIDTATKQVDKWEPDDREFLLEPIFVPKKSDVKPSGGDQPGWLVAQFIDSDNGRCGFYIFDGAAIAQGPVARLFLRDPLPSALHGCYCPNTPRVQ